MCMFEIYFINCYKSKSFLQILLSVSKVQSYLCGFSEKRRGYIIPHIATIFGF
jgi:hypothetical protein